MYNWGCQILRQTDEMNQANEYIESIYYGNSLNCKPKIKAFVVGDKVSLENRPLDRP